MNSAAAAAPPASAPERADLLAWLAVAAGTLGAFMAMLDVSIVSAALPVIQGEIGATQAEGTWVSTSYLVAEIVVMPLTVWLERMMGLRRVLLFGASLFTLFSVICGFADTLTEMILGRIGQGLAGGTLIPTGMTIMAKRLPPSQQSLGVAVYAMAALFGPIIGPLLGGWITENYSWHYAFFMNVPICAGLVVLIMVGLPKERGDWSELTNADWLGVAGMVIGLGCVTTLLEEGHREQWFESALIQQLAVASLIGFAMVAAGQMRARRPVMQLGLLRDPALSSALLLIVVNGAMLFCTLFTVPQFLAAVAGYNPYQAGQVVFLTGALSIVSALTYPALISRLDIRLIVGAAGLLVAASSWFSGNMTADSRGGDFMIGQILLGLGAAYAAIPLQQAAISAVSVEDAGEATGMFNIARNVGASLGLAFIASFLDQRVEFHQWRLHDSLAANDPEWSARLGQMAEALGGGAEGMAAALRALNGVIIREALVMSFNDIFLTMTAVSLLALPLLLLLRPLDPERAQGGVAH